MTCLSKYVYFFKFPAFLLMIVIVNYDLCSLAKLDFDISTLIATRELKSTRNWQLIREDHVWNFLEDGNFPRRFREPRRNRLKCWDACDPVGRTPGWNHAVCCGTGSGVKWFLTEKIVSQSHGFLPRLITIPITWDKSIKCFSIKSLSITVKPR